MIQPNKSEQENGDKRSRGGSSTDDASRRTSAASLEEGASRLGLQTPAGAQPSGTSPGATAGSGTTQSTSTMSDAASAPNFSAGGNAGVRSASPQASGDNYRHHGAASTGGGANASANENRKTSGGSFNPYTLSPSIAVVNAPDNGIGGSSPVSPHRSPGAGRRDGGRGPTFSSMDPQPRTTPNFSLYVVTQNLGLPSLQIPTTSSSSHRRSASAGGAGDDGALSAGSLLAPPHEMVSPFASSSTSDSTFSTPSDVTRRSWHGFGAGTSSAVPVSPYPRTGAGSGLASPFPEPAHGPLETTPAGQIHHRQTPYFLHVPFGGSGGSPSPVDAGFGDDDGSGAISSMFDTLSASSFDDSPYGSADPDVSSLMAAGGYGQFGQDHGMARRNDHHYHQQPHHNLSVRSPVLSSSFPFSTPAPPLRNVQSSELQPSSLVAPATAPLPDRLSALAAVGRRLGGHRSKVGTGGLTRVEKRGSVGPGDRAAARISRRRLSSVIANIGVVTGPVGDSMRPALSGQPPPQLEDGIGSAWLSGDCGMRKSEAVVFVTPTTPIGHDSHLRALAGDGCSDSSQTALSLATSTAVPVVYHATDGAVDYTADQVANHPSSQAPATGPAVASTLSRATRNAIPAYLDVYWARLHPLLPIVHRPSFDEAIALADGAMEGETGSARKTSKTSSMFATTMAGPGAEVLRCAMAAIATQYFDTKDDHIRGNQLHEHVWLEAKRVSCPRANA